MEKEDQLTEFEQPSENDTKLVEWVSGHIDAWRMLTKWQ